MKKIILLFALSITMLMPMQSQTAGQIQNLNECYEDFGQWEWQYVWTIFGTIQMPIWVSDVRQVDCQTRQPI